MICTGSLRTVILTESYFGKPKLCLEMEKCIHDIRAKFPLMSTKSTEKVKDIHAYIGLRDVIHSNGFDSKVMNSPEWKKFKKLLEKQFGFWSVSFILLSIQDPNAAAVQIAGHLENIATSKPYNSLKVDQQGFHYKPEDEFCIMIMITEGLLFDSRYSDAEVLAVMLHEIGHCFDSAVFKYMGPLSFLTAVSNIKEKLGASTLIATGFAALNTNKIRNDQQVEQMNDVIEDKKQGKLISLMLSGALYYLEKILALKNYKKDKEKAILAILGFAGPIVGKSAIFLYKKLVPIITFLRKIMSFNPINMIKDNIKSMFLGKAQEHFADKFAAMHGYGPELVTGLGKLETGRFTGSLLDDAIDKVPIVRDVYGLTVAGVFGVYTSLMSTDAHPNFAARFNSIKNIVKADLNDPNIDPKTKKLLTKQLEELDASFKKVEDNGKQQGATGKWHARLYKAYNKILPGRGDISSFIMDKTGIMSDKKISARVNSFRDKKFRLK